MLFEQAKIARERNCPIVLHIRAQDNDVWSTNEEAIKILKQVFVN